MLCCGEGFVSSDKKAWKKPEITSFKNAEEAIEYFSKHGTPGHVEAVKRLFAEAERRKFDAKESL
jgi:hypothetical protein